jgi:hypothetical protein
VAPYQQANIHFFYGKGDVNHESGTRTPTPRSSSPWTVAIPTTLSRLLSHSFLICLMALYELLGLFSHLILFEYPYNREHLRVIVFGLVLMPAIVKYLQAVW